MTCATCPTSGRKQEQIPTPTAEGEHGTITSLIPIPTARHNHRRDRDRATRRFLYAHPRQDHDHDGARRNPRAAKAKTALEGECWYMQTSLSRMRQPRQRSQRCRIVKPNETRLVRRRGRAAGRRSGIYGQSHTSERASEHACTRARWRVTGEHTRTRQRAWPHGHSFDTRTNYTILS